MSYRIESREVQGDLATTSCPSAWKPEECVDVSDVTMIIEALGMEAHPEGGYYAESYRCRDEVPRSALPARYDGPRNVSTAIYYLLEAGDFSAIHRLDSDEIFHYYKGDPLEVFLLEPAQQASFKIVGPDLADGMLPQVVIPHGTFFGARPQPGGDFGFSLVGTTVAPGFDFEDFEMGDANVLLQGWPNFDAEIMALIRE